MNISYLYNLMKKVLISCLYFFIIGGGLSIAANGEIYDSIYTDEIHMVKKDLVTISVYALTRLSITDPSIVDVVEADDKEVLVVAQEEGESTMFIWDEHGKRSITFHISGQMLEVTQKRIKQILKEADIQGLKLELNAKEGKVIISGDVPEHKMEAFEKVLGGFSDKVINLVKEDEVKDLIQIDLQVTELNTTLTKSLGVDWSTGSNSGITPSYSEAIPEFDGSIGDFFKIGDFTRVSSDVISAKIHALLEEGEARILSQPRLVVVSGEEASFLVGGEIPVRTTTISDTGSQESVSFKSYGISMSLTPEIQKEKVDITLNVEVSDVDASNAVDSTVAFTTRSASTHLYLDDGQMIILAGLIKQNRSKNIKRVPYVSSIPIIGLLFRSKTMPTPDLDQEMVISITPHILAKNRNSIVGKNQGETDKSNIHREGVSGKITNRPALPYYAGIPKEMTEYIRRIQQKIAQEIVYPQEAEQYNWEGTVKVGLLILKDGTLAYALVKESSGHDIFDEDALRIAKYIAPYESFPSDTEIPELNITIPIVYQANQ